jgi:hypothetical protein
MNDFVEFSSTLDEDDYGLIVGSDGSLKGIWVPEGNEDAEVPEVIVELCKDYFGIDPNMDNIIDDDDGYLH